MLEGYRVLIVDDSKAMRTLLKNVILRNAITPNVFEAANGREAFSIFPQISPDLIIMDLLMPEMDGLEATRKIHALDPTIAILVITTSDRIADTQESIQHGAVEVMKKPFNPNEMAMKITKILREKDKRIAKLYNESTDYLVHLSKKDKNPYIATKSEKEHLDYIKNKIEGEV